MKFKALFAILFLGAAVLSGQTVFSLFQSGRAVPGATVGDTYYTSTTTGVISPPRPAPGAKEG